MRSLLMPLLLILLQVCRLCQSFAPVLHNSGVTAIQRARSHRISMSKDEDMTEEEREIAIEKATKAMTAFSNTYLKNTNTKYCTDKSIPAVVIKGLAEHKVTLGAPLCPCRYYEDKEKEAKDGFWNCPCVPMRERHECHCMLFLTEDSDFAGEETVSTSMFSIRSPKLFFTSSKTETILVLFYSNYLMKR